MEKGFYTVSEFAKICGISKQAIYQRLNKSLKDFVKVEQGRKYISAAAFSLFNIEDFENIEAADSKENLNKVEQDFQSTLNKVEQGEFARFLQGQIEEKDKQISRLQEELSAANGLISKLTLELTEITRQAQELNRNNQVLLLNQKEIKRLEAGEAGGGAEEKKPSVFSRLFKRKAKEE